MRRIILLITAMVLVLAVATGASAASTVSTAGCYATVASDGSCQVTLTATLHLESAQDDLSVLLPGDAQNVTLNGSRTRTTKHNDLRKVDLSKVAGHAAGEFTVTMNYTLPDVVNLDEDEILTLSLPLLSGFDYAISQMEFTVTLPGEVAGEPGFSSGYHKADIEKSLTYTVTGATVSGKFTKELKDHETLLMTMAVSPEMFPQPAINVQSTDVGVGGMIVCGVLALLYWIFFLRCLPVWKQYATQPPEGITAGHIGCVVQNQGVDLTLMVLTWAQLGYVYIRIHRQRVILEKRMEMGNERSEYELRWFRKLFGRKDRVDTTGTAYAELRREAAKNPAGLRGMLRAKGGNGQIFRILASGVGLFGGVCVGLSLGSGAVLQWLVVGIFGIFGGISGYCMQGWLGSLRLRSKKTAALTLILSGMWLGLGAAAEIFPLTLWMVIGLLVAGLLLSVGGGRTEYGRYTKGQLLGLRWYLRKATKGELQRICATDPDYFFSLAPCAVALGVDKTFAKNFGSIRLLDCPYMASRTDAHLTALQWQQRLRYAADQMDERYRRLPWEKFLQLIGSFRK